MENEQGKEEMGLSSKRGLGILLIKVVLIGACEFAGDSWTEMKTGPSDCCTKHINAPPYFDEAFFVLNGAALFLNFCLYAAPVIFIAH
jgi:hypothetical protein